MHFNNPNKQIPKLVNVNFKIGFKNVIFRTDSKGSSTSPLLVGLIKYTEELQISQITMQEYNLNRIKRTPYPIVGLLFGTCELKNKQGKFIHLLQNIKERVNQIIEEYTNYKRKILEYNYEF